ncbi:MAG: ester cyclase, partial [Thermomicrobiales bacterium]
MPRTAAAFTILLTLITGMVVGQLQLVADSRVMSTPAQVSESVDTRIAFDFYESLNDVIRTGDVSDLRSVIAPGFVERSPASSTEGSLRSLERYARSLHVKDPDAVIHVIDVTAGGALIAVRLRFEGDSVLTIAGLPVIGAIGDSYELLRIEDGKILERWASSALPPMIETLGVLDIANDPEALREPRLERLDFAPGAELSIEEHEGTILRVASGSMAITHTGREQSTSMAQPGYAPNNSSEMRHVLAAGDSLSIAANEPFRIRNSGGQGASLIWLGIRTVNAQLDPADVDGLHAPPSGIERVLIAGGASIRPEQGPFSLIAERMVAAPGTLIPVHTTDECELLLAESGSVEIDIH